MDRVATHVLQEKYALTRSAILVMLVLKNVPALVSIKVRCWIVGLLDDVIAVIAVIDAIDVILCLY